MDTGFLNNCEPVYETEHLRCVHFCNPVIIKMDGHKGIGVVLKPANNVNG